MSPELISPERFGFNKSRPTECSDCYALGMVVYETVNGSPPFHQDSDFIISSRIVKGERPLRQAAFTDHLWKMLEGCWSPQPNDRPRIKDVLQCLQMAPSLPERRKSRSLSPGRGLPQHSSAVRAGDRGRDIVNTPQWKPGESCGRSGPGQRREGGDQEWSPHGTTASISAFTSDFPGGPSLLNGGSSDAPNNPYSLQPHPTNFPPIPHVLIDEYSHSLVSHHHPAEYVPVTPPPLPNNRVDYLTSRESSFPILEVRAAYHELFIMR